MDSNDVMISRGREIRTMDWHAVLMDKRNAQPHSRDSTGVTSADPRGELGIFLLLHSHTCDTPRSYAGITIGPNHQSCTYSAKLSRRPKTTMVFPTRGCRTCVTRRIKCDTTQPICGRCSKADRACLWDPNDQAGFHFKSENAFAQGARRRPRASKVGGPPPITSAIAIVRQESPQPALALSLDDHAFNYWFRNYIARPEDLDESGHEYTVHLMPYYIKAKTGSCLHLAVSTLSQAVFGRSRKLPDALMRADRSYLRCLAKTQQAVGGDAYEGIDELLLTTMLMGYFENTRYNVRNGEIADRKEDAVGSRFENVFCHYEGAMGLLRVRHERHNGGDLTLDRVVRRQIVSGSTF